MARSAERAPARVFGVRGAGELLSGEGSVEELPGPAFEALGRPEPRVRAVVQKLVVVCVFTSFLRRGPRRSVSRHRRAHDPASPGGALVTAFSTRSRRSEAK